MASKFHFVYLSSTISKSEMGSDISPAKMKNLETLVSSLRDINVLKQLFKCLIKLNINIAVWYLNKQQNQDSQNRLDRSEKILSRMVTFVHCGVQLNQLVLQPLFCLVQFNKIRIFICKDTYFSDKNLNVDRASTVTIYFQLSLCANNFFQQNSSYLSLFEDCHDPACLYHQQPQSLFVTVTKSKLAPCSLSDWTKRFLILQR